MRKKNRSTAATVQDELFTAEQQRAMCKIAVLDEPATPLALWSVALSLWHMATHPAEKREWLHAADYWRDYLAAQ